MLTKWLFSVILSLIPLITWCQVRDVSHLMTRRYISCQDIVYNVQFLIPEYHKKGATDTLNAIVNYWENNCGSSEELTRVKILLAIEEHSFAEHIYSPNIIDHLVMYRTRNTIIPFSYGRVYHQYNWYFNYGNSDTLKYFTQALARRLLKSNNIKPIEKFFLLFYSNEFAAAFDMMWSEALHGTHLRDLYLIETENLINKPSTHIAYLAGAWIPQDNLNLLGTHPFLGFRIGVMHKQLIADASLGIKFGNSRNQYQVFYEDSLWNTNHFFGGYIGLDAGYEVLKIGKQGISVIGGIAYDGFDALKDNDKDSREDISKSINSLNLNSGIGYKYHLQQWNYLGIEVKYNYLNYKNPKGSDLNGNAITLNLIYGFSSNRYAINRLRALNYIQSL